MIDRDVSWKSILQAWGRMIRCGICTEGCLHAYRRDLHAHVASHLHACVAHRPAALHTRVFSMDTDMHNSCSLLCDLNISNVTWGWHRRGASHCTVPLVILRCQKQTIFPRGHNTSVKHSHLPNRKTWVCWLLQIELFPKNIFYSTQTQQDRAVLALRESSNTHVILF